MKKVVMAILIGMMGIASQANAQLRPAVDQREAVLNAHQARLRKATVNTQRIEQARISQQRIEQARIEQTRIEHERVKKHRIKQARIKNARIKAAREQAAGDGLDHPARRRYELAKKKRVRLADTTTQPE